MRRLFAQRAFEFLGFWKNRAVMVDKPSKRTAEAFAIDASDQQCEMNVAAGFVPGAEAAGGDVIADTLGGAAEEREFPIVNDACAVRGQVRHPAVIEDMIEQQ